MKEFDFSRQSINFKMSAELNTYESNGNLAIILNCRYNKPSSGREVEERYDIVTTNLVDDRLVGNRVAVEDGVWKTMLFEALCKGLNLKTKKIGSATQNKIEYSIYKIANPGVLKENSYISNEEGINKAVEYANQHD